MNLAMQPLSTMIEIHTAPTTDFQTGSLRLEALTAAFARTRS
jgi:hypothetical protein